MSVHEDCKKLYEEKVLNSTTEPKLYVNNYSDCRSGSRSHQFEMKGDNTVYTAQDFDTLNWHDDIDILAIPPNMTVKVYKHGIDRPDPNVTLGPGGIEDLDNTIVGRNEASRLEINRVKSWEQHLVDCCMNRGDMANCGQFWGGKNTGACDPIMKNHCYKEENKTKDECSCFNPVDEYGQEVPQPQCFFNKCIHSGYQTRNMTEGVDCGTYCAQIFDMGGNENTAIDDQKLNQHCGSGSGGSGNGGGSGIFQGENILSQKINIAGQEVSYSTIGGLSYYICCCCIIIIVAFVMFRKGRGRRR